MSPLRVAVVPHTHWDREWYATFESFRGRLVALLDELLDLLEHHPGYTHFMLDGQLAVVDDYVAVRPDGEERIRSLVGGGRVSVGPWYTLPDEFCVSGETLVRDLQLGLARADQLGGSMAVGYLPDMFGHIAQMPQLLRLVGFDRAVVWRGVPAAIDRTSFRWSSPGGCTVLAEYLWEGYGNGASVSEDPAAFVERVRRLAAELGPARHGDLLFMNGTDHELPQPWLPRVVADATRLDRDLDVRITGLEEALGSRPQDGALPSWKGELRSGARANLLMGVLSNRVDVKQAAARAERLLERTAEPLCALWLEPARWPAALLDEAWLAVVRNAAHDSSCACSADEVCDAVLARYRSASGTARSLVGLATSTVAARASEAGLAVVNPVARRRAGLIEVELPGLVPTDAQVLDQRRPVLDDRVLRGADAHAWLERWRSQQLDEQTFVVEVDVAEHDDVVDLTLRTSPWLMTNLLVPAIRDDVARRVDAGAGRALHLRIVQAPAQRLLCWSGDVPGFGWSRWDPAQLAVAPVQVDGLAMRNGLATVAVDAATGTFSLDGCDGLARLVESGDHGDTYNYCPPDHDRVVDAPTSVEVTVAERGPLRGRIRVAATYAWPGAIDFATHARVGERTTKVETTVELRAGEPWARIRHEWDNQSRDHRVRTVLPLGEPVVESRAECAFAVVTRGLRGEGGPTERAMATFPSRRFVQAGQLTVVHDGLLEYELTDRGGAELAPDARAAEALALTLVRSTGLLSRVDVPYRPLPAGPPLPVPGAQLQGPVRASYAVCVDPTVDPFAMADEVLVPLLSVPTRGGGPIAASSEQALDVSGCEVSAVRREGGALVVRIHNPGHTERRASVPGRHGWVVDLRGRPLRPFADGLVLGPWEIATLRLEEA